jgi:hypothetical protein
MEAVRNLLVIGMARLETIVENLPDDDPPLTCRNDMLCTCQQTICPGYTMPTDQYMTGLKKLMDRKDDRYGRKK